MSISSFISEFQKYEKTHFLEKIISCHYGIGGSEIGQKVKLISEMAPLHKILCVFPRVSKINMRDKISGRTGNRT